ncbi:MAG: hypothetical protein H0U86_08645 [Chloroflexi bacterium]|nr:hypothetical protein [Chloroflexota bacterium]
MRRRSPETCRDTIVIPSNRMLVAQAQIEASLVSADTKLGAYEVEVVKAGRRSRSRLDRAEFTGADARVPFARCIEHPGA